MPNAFIDINLLPRPVQPARGGPAWLRLLLPGLVLIAVAAVMLLGAALLHSRNMRTLAAQQREQEALRPTVQQVVVVEAETGTLQQQITTIATQSEQLEADAERVNGSNPPLAPFLRAVTEPLLPRMKVTGVVSSGPNLFRVQGEAGSDALVVSYMEALRRRPEIRSVTARSIEQLGGNAPPGAVRWVLEIER